MWKIGHVEIKNRIVFAPMAGISNEVFRGLIKEMDAGLIYSEMVSNMGIIYNSKNTIDMLKINDKVDIVGELNESMDINPENIP